MKLELGIIIIEQIIHVANIIPIIIYFIITLVLVSHTAMLGYKSEYGMCKRTGRIRFSYGTY